MYCLSLTLSRFLKDLRISAENDTSNSWIAQKSSEICILRLEEILETGGAGLIIRKNHGSDHYIYGCIRIPAWLEPTPDCNLTTPGMVDNTLEVLIQWCFVITILCNVFSFFRFFSRNTRILGKYILMFLEVCLTFAKLMLPFGFFLFLMAVCLFTVYYFVALAEQVNNQPITNWWTQYWDQGIIIPGRFSAKSVENLEKRQN